MANIITAEELKTRLMSGYDPQYHTRIYRQMSYAFGEPWNKAVPTADARAGDLPDWQDIVVRYQEIGRSRRILNTALLSAAALMGSEVAPEWGPGIDKQTAEGRKQIYLARYRGEDVDGGWGQEYENAFIDGDQLGLGFLHWGARTNPKSGFQRATCQHVSPLYVIYDRHARTPSRARWAAIIDHMAVEDAVALYGSKVEQYKREMVDSESTEPFEAVRLIYYYDLGFGGKEPAMAVIPDNLSNDPVDGTLEDNIFEEIPLTYMLNFLAPGMRRPIGRVMLQMATQEMLNELERYMKHVLREGPGFDIANIKLLEEADVKRRNKGDKTVVIRQKGSVTFAGDAPWTRVPAMEPPAFLMNLWNIFERQFSSDSQTTDYQHQNMASTTRSATEVAVLQSEAQGARSWIRKQTLLFMIRNVQMATRFFAKFDRDPLEIELNGFQIPVNDPGRPGTSMANWCSKPARPIITPDALDASDKQQVKVDRLNDLATLEAYAQAGVISGEKYIEERLKAIGEDPTEWLPAGMQQNANPGVAAVA